MSTKQTDASIDFQMQVYVNFDEMVSKWFDGEVDFDEIEEELQRLLDDEDIMAMTYQKCQKIWTEAQLDDTMFQREDYEKWEGLRQDS